MFSHIKVNLKLIVFLLALVTIINTELPRPVFSDLKPGIHPTITGSSNKIVIPGIIKYQKYGAKVLTGLTKINLIYYGTWTDEQKTIVNNFISTLGSSAWFNVEKPYYYQASPSSRKIFTTGPLKLGNTLDDNYSRGKLLNSTIIGEIVYESLINKNFPLDPNAVYLVLTSDDVEEGQFCDQYCGYHSYFNIGRQYYQFGFVGNTDRCPKNCIMADNQQVSPNDDTGVDGMLSVIAHEIVEAMSDPLLNAWGDDKGNENADKCAWEFGKLKKLSNGAFYNMNFGGKYYLIQKNWDRVKQGCALQ